MGNKTIIFFFKIQKLSYYLYSFFLFTKIKLKKDWKIFCIPIIPMLFELIERNVIFVLYYCITRKDSFVNSISYNLVIFFDNLLQKRSYCHAWVYGFYKIFLIFFSFSFSPPCLFTSSLSLTYIPRLFNGKYISLPCLINYVVSFCSE